MYNRQENPFWQLQDFLKKVEQAYDRKTLKDDSSKFEVLLTGLSPEAKERERLLPDAQDKDRLLPDQVEFKDD